MRLIFQLGTSHPRGLNSDLPYPLGRVENASTTKFFFSFTSYANIETFPTYFVTDEGPGPKRLEKNSNQNTALLFINLLFLFVELSLT